MKIIDIEAIPTRIGLKKPFKIALGTQTHSQNVIVRMSDDEGHVGWAETTTFHVIYGYDQQMLHHVIADVLAPAVIGLDPRDLAGLHEAMDLAIPYNEMAKNGIDLAAYDLVGRATEQPLHALLGGKRMDRIPVVGIVGIEPPDEAAARAAAQVEAGYETIKIKIGLEPEEDIARVKAVRQAVGDGVLLRVDANQRYDRDTALKACRQMEQVGLEWIEQPLPEWDLEGHAMLADRLDTPIALDESIHSVHDARRAIRLGAAQVINIKINRVGGIYRARQVVAVCAEEGVPCFLGSNIETSPGTAAWAHFYAATDNVSSATEIGGPTLYADDLVAEPLVPQSGFLTLPEGPGIGIELDTDKLERYRISF